MAVPPLFRARFGRVPEMHPLTLRFLDPVMEAWFRARYIDDNLSFIRVAVGLGIAVWVVFGLLAGLVLEGDDRTADLLLRYGFAVPLGVIDSLRRGRPGTGGGGTW